MAGRLDSRANLNAVVKEKVPARNSVVRASMIVWTE
jgi:hypothetical protein